MRTDLAALRDALTHFYRAENRIGDRSAENPKTSKKSS
jgi:hypothetical protein